MSADGTGSRTLAPGAHRDLRPAWVGGGTHLEYVGVRAQEAGVDAFHLDLRVVAIAGGDDRLVAQDTTDPASSPDGVWVAAIARGDVTLHGPGLTGVRRLATTPESESDPTWSPSGDDIACLAVGRDGTELVVFDAATGNRRSLARADDRTCRPTWSPDGAWIAFTAGSPPDVWVVPSKGGAPRRITRGGGSWPAFRPRLR
jgi:TolB protein